MRTLLPIMIAVLLAGCAATKEMRVRMALADAGVPAAQAACMAAPMARQLSTQQLRDLGRVAGLNRDTLGQLTLGEAYSRISRVVDAPTLAVITRAGLACLLRG
jgi:hypothetical protein